MKDKKSSNDTVERKRLPLGLILVIIFVFISALIGLLTPFIMELEWYIDLFLLLLSVLGIVIGIGLIKRKNIARIFAIVFYTGGAVFGLYSLFDSFSWEYFENTVKVSAIIRIIISVVIIWYLLRKDTKDVFR